MLPTICVKNISLFAIAGLMYWLVGYNLMYGIAEGGYIGELFSVWSADDSAIAGETPDFSGGYASGSDWYFQMVFCATTASIVSGTIAERMKLVAVPYLHAVPDRIYLSDRRQLGVGHRLARRYGLF
jgi:Amt family ammonium transporter